VAQVTSIVKGPWLAFVSGMMARGATVDTAWGDIRWNWKSGLRITGIPPEWINANNHRSPLVGLPFTQNKIEFLCPDIRAFTPEMLQQIKRWWGNDDKHDNCPWEYCCFFKEKRAAISWETCHKVFPIITQSMYRQCPCNIYGEEFVDWLIGRVILGIS